MSAALAIWVNASATAPWEDARQEQVSSASHPNGAELPRERTGNLAFYRRHTEKTLRRYLYASMLVGRAPSVLKEPLSRGWASSRPVKTFEDAVIFLLDIERCLDKLNSLDKQVLCKVVVQDYTQSEAACLLGMSSRTMSERYPQALDRLTRILLDADLLLLPH